MWRTYYALPAEHGAWIWWVGPLLIGLGAGGGPSRDFAVLALTGLAAFLSRQPAVIAVKTLSRRRPRRDLGPALAWLTIYGLMASLGVLALVLDGHTRILALAVPGLPVFAWHLWLVSQREERGQMGIELVAAGALALAAPAAYWISGGLDPLEPWVLWALTWLQSAASIVGVNLRLRERRLASPPPDRWRMGLRTLLYHAFNQAASLALAAARLVPWLVPAAFSLTLLDAVEGVARPPVGAKPTAIGVRQLAVSSAFVMVMVLAYRL